MAIPECRVNPILAVPVVLKILDAHNSKFLIVGFFA